jgi:glycosyltransferase involved in cell wall biosynthesis
VRIGIVAPPWVPVPPPRYGGTERVIDAIARGFLAGGQEVLLWTTGDATCPVPRAWVLPGAEGIGGWASVALQHAVEGHRALAAWGADVIHDHTLAGPLVTTWVHHIPTVTTVHGPFDDAARSLYGLVTPRVGVIAISHDQAAHAGAVPVLAVIHHGVDLTAFRMGAGTGDDQGPYLAFLGRMAPDKGAHLAALAARRAGWRLLLAARMRGEAEHEYFRSRLRPLLGDGVTYLGELDNGRRVELLRGATALVNPIQWDEPFGLAMVEALACGTPVAALRAGSAPEIVDDGVTGFLCDDVDELTERLADVAALDRRSCRAAAEQRFSLERMVADHVSLFRRVLGAPGP